MALLKDGTRIYGNAIVDGNIAVGEIYSAGNISVTSNVCVWQFGTDGTLTVAPGEVVLRSIGDSVTLQSYDPGTGNIYSGYLGDTGGWYLNNTVDGAWFSIDGAGGNASVYSASGLGGAGGKNLLLTAGASDSLTWNSNPGGNVTITGGYGSFGDGGGGPGGFVNITGGGSYDSHAGNVNITSNVSTWQFGYDGVITFPDGTRQSTASHISSAYDAYLPSVSIDNFRASMDGSGNPTVAAISGTFTSDYSLNATLHNGATYSITAFGAQGVTFTSLFGSGVGVTFGYASDTLVGMFTNRDTGNLYRVTWMAGPTGPGTGYGSISIEKLI